MATELWRKQHRLADRWVPAFARAVEAQREAVLAEWRRLGEEPRASEIERFLGRIVSSPPPIVVTKAAPSASLAETYSEVITGSARLALVAEPITQDEFALLADPMTVTNPFAVQVAEASAAELVRGVNRETVDAIRSVIANATRNGGAPRETARLVETVIGLDGPRANATANFQRALEARVQTGKSGSALGRARALAPRVPARLQPKDVQRLVDGYAKRLLRERALTIARTETIRAANAGTRLAGQAMATLPGKTTADIAFVWIVTPDDRLCPRCVTMEHQVTGYATEFAEPGGSKVTVSNPPLHPRCRCAIARKVKPV